MSREEFVLFAMFVMSFTGNSPLFPRPLRRICGVAIALLLAGDVGGSHLETLSTHSGKHSKACDDHEIVQVAGAGISGANGIYTCASSSSGNDKLVLSTNIFML